MVQVFASQCILWYFLLLTYLSSFLVWCIGRLVIWTQWHRVHQILLSTARYQTDRFDRPATWCCLFVPFRCRHSLQILPSLSDASNFSFCVQFCIHRRWLSARLYATNSCQSLLLFCESASFRCVLSFTKFYRNPSSGSFKFYCRSRIFLSMNAVCFLWIFTGRYRAYVMSPIVGEFYVGVKKLCQQEL